MPIGVWLVNVLLVAAIGYSFAPIARQRAVYERRYRARLSATRVSQSVRRDGEEALPLKAPAASLWPPLSATAAAATAASSGLASSPASAAPPPVDDFHLAPDLRQFSVFSATQYVLSHAILHLVV
jgi:hypothetical protein